MRVLAAVAGVFLTAALAGCAPDPGEQVNALYAAERDGTLGLEQVREALASDSARVRASAAALAARALEPDAAIPVVLPLLSDPEAGVRATAASSLGDLQAGVAVEELSRLVASDKSSVVRIKAAQALRKIGDPAGAPALASALDAVEVSLRREAAQGLETLAAPETVDALIEALDDEDVRVRAWAARALASIGDPRVRPALERLAESDNPLDRGAALNALESLDQAAGSEE